VRYFLHDIMVGPYWPMSCFVTIPLILGISFLVAYYFVFQSGQSTIIQILWTLLTLCLCRNPGILPRYREPPTSSSS